MALFDSNKKSEGQDQQKPTTQAQLPIAEIRNGIVVLKDNSLRLVMLCSTVNFELKSEQEQSAIISGYQGFLNSLDFPIQIVIQSRRMDLTKYLGKLNNQVPKASNELVRVHIQDYIRFIKSLLRIANIMDKKFFIIIPYTLPLAKKPGVMEDFRRATNKEPDAINLTNFEKYKKELTQRAQVVASGISGLGLRAVQLNTQELVELLYSTYNPDIAQHQRLTSVKSLSMAPKLGKVKPQNKKQGE